MGLMEAEREVAGMVHSGTPFDAIEDRIQIIPGLVDNERSGLWLYAWSRQGSVLGSETRRPSSCIGWNIERTESGSTRDKKPPVSRL